MHETAWQCQIGHTSTWGFQKVSEDRPAVVGNGIQVSGLVIGGKLPGGGSPQECVVVEGVLAGLRGCTAG